LPLSSILGASALAWGDKGGKQHHGSPEGRRALLAFLGGFLDGWPGSAGCRRLVAGVAAVRRLPFALFL
jgi:hypothetical protein